MTGTDVTYCCKDCNFTIDGKSWDPQEYTLLYCPRCGEEMGYEVFWS